MIDLEKVTRLEVIDDEGRQLVRYFEPGQLTSSLQDDSQTLKLFLKELPVLPIKDPEITGIIYNGITTPDGTELVSRSRHDYKTHVDANGKEYMVDGGLDYVRRSTHGDEYPLVCRYEDTVHEQAREMVTWGTYGINGDEPLQYKKVSEMDDDHLRAVIETQRCYPQVKAVMRDELNLRGIEL